MKYCFGILLLMLVNYSLFAQQKIVVAKDGSGSVTTVQEAINLVKDNNEQTTIIFIKNGTYKEKLQVPVGKNNIHMIGESVEGVVLSYDDYASKKDTAGNNIGTSGSSSFFMYAENFTAENITFENSSGPVGQAVAARITGDKAKFINCRFLGFQDTLYTHGDNSRQYYFKCYIEGTVDFIFGAATAVFDSCIIHGKKAGYYTAASTPESKLFGYVFRDCKITGDAEPSTYYLGRPWRPYAKTVYLHCAMGNMIKPEGWNNWGKESNEATVFYGEYENNGPGYQPGQRAAWSHQLTAQEASNYTLENIFGDWQVSK